MIVENFLELVDIEEIEFSDEYINMVDITVDEDQSFLLSNGIISHNSAAGATRNFRDPETVGSFALRGKFINVSELTTAKLVENREAVNLMAAIGLKLGHKVDIEQLRYGKVIIYTDQDYDGYAISALLLNFFNKYWSELFDLGIIYKAETPIVVATNIKNKEVIKFYKHNEYDSWLKKIDPKLWDISYKKGLSALTPDEYKDIINNPVLTKIEKSDTCDGKLNIWFGKNSEARKNELVIDIENNTDNTL